MVPFKILSTNSCVLFFKGSIAMNTCEQLPQLPRFNLSMPEVESPPDNSAAIRSSIIEKPDPFQYPIGNILRDSSIDTGSSVRFPLLSKPPG